MPERRTNERSASKATARIIDGSNLLTRCEIQDISATGVRIKIDPTVPLQNEFNVFSGKVERGCRLVWRNGELLGAEFVKEDSPRR